jgi:hypothetical protein
MQARNVKIDPHPRRDRECCLSTANVAHCQGGILLGNLRDVRYLITITMVGLGSEHIQLNVTYWGAVDGCKTGVVTQSNSTHNSLRVS